MKRNKSYFEELDIAVCKVLRDLDSQMGDINRMLFDNLVEDMAGMYAANRISEEIMRYSREHSQDQASK